MPSADQAHARFLKRRRAGVIFWLTCLSATLFAVTALGIVLGAVFLKVVTGLDEFRPEIAQTGDAGDVARPPGSATAPSAGADIGKKDEDENYFQETDRIIMPGETGPSATFADPPAAQPVGADIGNKEKEKRKDEEDDKDYFQETERIIMPGEIGASATIDDPAAASVPEWSFSAEPTLLQRWVTDPIQFLVGLIFKEDKLINPREAGFLQGIVCSIWLLVLVTLIAIPVGVGAAVFLEEYRLVPSPVRSIIQLNISNLAGVPSIVYGLLGLAVFYRAFGFERLALGRSLLTGALTLSLLILPIIIIATQEALRAIPISLRHGALALGATQWQAVRDHVLPAATPGIMTGIILALSRAIGETAPLLIVGAGSILVLPTSPMSAYNAFPVQIYEYAKAPGEAFKVIAAGGILLLLLLLLSMNACAILIRNRYSHSSRT